MGTSGLDRHMKEAISISEEAAVKRSDYCIPRAYLKMY